MPDEMPDEMHFDTDVVAEGKGQGREGKVNKEKKEVEPRAKNTRGHRIPADWILTPELEAFAVKAGMTADRAKTTADNFRDYWIAATGQKATKTDWSATWRMWVRREIERSGASRLNGTDPDAPKPRLGSKEYYAANPHLKPQW